MKIVRYSMDEVYDSKEIYDQIKELFIMKQL